MRFTIVAFLVLFSSQASAGIYCFAWSAVCASQCAAIVGAPHNMGSEHCSVFYGDEEPCGEGEGEWVQTDESTGQCEGADEDDDPICVPPSVSDGGGNCVTPDDDDDDCPSGQAPDFETGACVPEDDACDDGSSWNSSIGACCSNNDLICTPEDPDDPDPEQDGDEDGGDPDPDDPDPDQDGGEDGGDPDPDDDGGEDGGDPDPDNGGDGSEGSDGSEGIISAINQLYQLTQAGLQGIIDGIARLETDNNESLIEDKLRTEELRGIGETLDGISTNGLPGSGGGGSGTGDGDSDGGVLTELEKQTLILQGEGYESSSDGAEFKDITDEVAAKKLELKTAWDGIKGELDSVLSVNLSGGGTIQPLLINIYNTEVDLSWAKWSDQLGGIGNIFVMVSTFLGLMIVLGAKSSD